MGWMCGIVTTRFRGILIFVLLVIALYKSTSASGQSGRFASLCTRVHFGAFLANTSILITQKVMEAPEESPSSPTPSPPPPKKNHNPALFFPYFIIVSANTSFHRQSTRASFPTCFFKSHGLTMAEQKDIITLSLPRSGPFVVN